MKADDDWRAASDAEALMRAEEVKADSARHAKAQAHLRQKHAQMERAMTSRKPGAAKKRLKNAKF
jgi:hypothetical protein